MALVTVLGWSTDLVILGATPLAWSLLGVRLLAVAATIPLQLATLRACPPPWVGAAELLVGAAYPVAYMIVFSLKPTNVMVQGGILVLGWLILALLPSSPLRPKLLVGVGTVALYPVHLAYLWGRLGEAYGKPNELLSLGLVAFFIVLGLSWAQVSFEERRWREFLVSERLRQEIALRREREQELEVSRARAEEAALEAKRAALKAEYENRLRATFVANISHDLRTPMAGILGLIELLRETPLNEEQAFFVETIHSSNQTLLALLNDILDLSRIEEGKLPLVPAATPLAKTLRDPVELLRPTAERKGLSLALELAADLPGQALIDGARLQQILLNLLGNAIKFTPRGSVTLRASAPPRGGGVALRVEVEDTGIGFSSEQRGRLFQRFSQADMAVTQRFGGSGLGLVICKGLVERMGGKIEAESTPGVGSRFWFEIPVEVVAPATPAAPATIAPSELPGLRVLLAEDNTVNQLVLLTMLRKLGQTVRAASNGQQALALLGEEPFDLVLMDIHMPILDGEQATRRLRASEGAGPHAFVVALTAGATAEEQERFREAGFDAIYSKPISLETLRRMLRQEGAAALARRQAAGGGA